MSTDPARLPKPEPVPATSTTIAGLSGLVGTHLGYTSWQAITQAQVDSFAEATWDDQWIHVDVERAKAGPFGGTIVHGFLTLSLAPVLLDDLLHVEDASRTINYGLERVRFPAPVPVGSRVRLGAELSSLEQVSGGVQAALALTFELEGSAKPGCVGTLLLRFVRD
ncbi:MAG: MaoC family dehydratase [Actinomycetota bacterium]|nr:MaoC family dehydratase [Actinomycetota bacterium]